MEEIGGKEEIYDTEKNDDWKDVACKYDNPCDMGKEGKKGEGEKKGGRERGNEGMRERWKDGGREFKDSSYMHHNPTVT